MRPATVTIEKINNGYLLIEGTGVLFVPDRKTLHEVFTLAIDEVDRIKDLNDRLSKENPQNGTN